MSTNNWKPSGDKTYSDDRAQPRSYSVVARTRSESKGRLRYPYRRFIEIRMPFSGKEPVSRLADPGLDALMTAHEVIRTGYYGG